MKRITAAGHAEFVGVGAELLFKFESQLQTRTGVLEFEHFLFLGDAAVKIALVPALKIGELIVGREEGMRFTIAFGLSDLVEPFPLGAVLHVLAVDRFAERLLDGEHGAVAEITVVGDGRTLPPVFFS